MDRDNVEVPEFFKIPFCIFAKWAHMRGFETIVLLDIMRNSAISLWVCVCFSTISFSQSKLSNSPTALRARSSKCEISVCVAYHLNYILFLFACEENQGQLIHGTKMEIFEGERVHFWQEAIDDSPGHWKKFSQEIGTK